MVLGYHVIFTAYGFWLPNDPRGSWSDFVGSWELVRFGKATKISTTRSVARVAHDRRLREAAKSALKFPPVHFSGRQALAVAQGFDLARQEGEYAIHACAILPEHVHLVIGRHARRIGQIIGHLKARGTQRLQTEGLWPEDARPVWARNGWKVFLDKPAIVAEAIRYVEGNPAREGKPQQRWSFLTPYSPSSLRISASASGVAVPCAAARSSVTRPRAL
jgi:REP element-mobilizing transposase RayT